MVFIAELFWWFEIVKPEFVQPRDVQEFKDGEILFIIIIIFFAVHLSYYCHYYYLSLYMSSFYRHIIIALKVVDLFFLSFLLTSEFF